MTLVVRVSFLNAKLRASVLKRMHVGTERAFDWRFKLTVTGLARATRTLQDETTEKSLMEIQYTAMFDSLARARWFTPAHDVEHGAKQACVYAFGEQDTQTIPLTILVVVTGVSRPWIFAHQIANLNILSNQKPTIQRNQPRAQKSQAKAT